MAVDWIGVIMNVLKFHIFIKVAVVLGALVLWYNIADSTPL